MRLTIPPWCLTFWGLMLPSTLVYGQGGIRALGPQWLGHGESEDAVGQTQKEFLGQELGEQQCALLRTRRAKVEGLAGKRTEHLTAAGRIGTLKARHTVAVVPATQAMVWSEAEGTL